MLPRAPRSRDRTGEFPRVVKNRLHDPPRLLDSVLASEKLAIADQSGIQQSFIGPDRFTEVFGERGVQVNALPRVAGLRGYLQAHARIWVDAQHNLVRLGRPAVGQESQPGNMVQEHPHLSYPLWQSFSGPQEDRHPGPAPVVDLGPECDIGLGLRVLGHPRDIAVTLVLAPHVVRRLQRRHGTEHLGLLVVEIVGTRTHRRLHRHQRQHLQQVILHDVSQGAHRVIELATVLDAEVLGHGDVNLGNALAIPQFGQVAIGEAQILQLHDGLLAQEVIDAQDLIFVEHGT